MQEEGANITVNSVHPGLIMTNLMRHSGLSMSMYSILTSTKDCLYYTHFSGILLVFSLTGIFRAFTCFMWKNVPQVNKLIPGKDFNLSENALSQKVNRITEFKAL